jgi:hypothetical protein
VPLEAQPAISFPVTNAIKLQHQLLSHTQPGRMLGPVLATHSQIGRVSPGSGQFTKARISVRPKGPWVGPCLQRDIRAWDLLWGKFRLPWGYESAHRPSLHKEKEIIQDISWNVMTWTAKREKVQWNSPDWPDFRPNYRAVNRWLRPEILATLEAEIRRMVVQK